MVETRSWLVRYHSGCCGSHCMAGRGESCISVMGVGMTTEQRLDHIEKHLGIMSMAAGLMTEERLDHVEKKLGIKSVARPEIGRYFWMHYWDDAPWLLWKSTKIGIVRIDDGGNTISHTWERFDGYVAEGECKVREVEIPQP